MWIEYNNYKRYHPDCINNVSKITKKHLSKSVGQIGFGVPVQSQHCDKTYKNPNHILGI